MKSAEGESLGAKKQSVQGDNRICEAGNKTHNERISHD